MIILLLFAFMAGVVTILSPCILPVLPIILAGSVAEGRRRPVGIILGFIASFTFFTLLLTAIVKATGLPADSLRLLAVVVIFLFGIVLLFPQTQVALEKIISRLSSIVPSTQNQHGLVGGLVIGASLGLIWAPCVGPILAAVITLAFTSAITLTAVLITLAYAVGTAIPMLVIMLGGRQLLQRVPWLMEHTPQIQKGFGLIMILLAVMIFFNWDRRFQAYVLTVFPEYGAGLTQLENNQVVQDQLDRAFTSGPITPAELNQPGVPAPDFIGGGPWINSDPVALSDLQGKVVLVDFWTYSCINCIRTFPYLREWYEKYKDLGFVIVGVHSPEFAFEKEYDNVLQATKDFNLTYPVVLDNEFAIWQAYSNRYWPAHYLIDATGTIRYTHFGEGEYEQTEAAIQALLKEAGYAPSASISSGSDSTPRVRQTPETYLGWDRLERFSSLPLPTRPNQNYTFAYDEPIPVNAFGYQGQWRLTPEAGVASSDSQLKLRFIGQKVYLVITPSTAADTIQVLIDGEMPNVEQAGEDVIDGVVTVTEPRLYELLNIQGPRGEHTLELQFDTPGTEVFAFTFG